MYCVYWNQGQGPITFGVNSCDLQFAINKKMIGFTITINEKFCFKFLRNYESFKVETWYTHGQSAIVLFKPESQGHILLRAISLDRFYNFAINENFLSHFSQLL